MENEIWKDIPGYEGHYQVSNLGRVKSLERVVDHKKYGTQKRIGKILNHSINQQGYHCVKLYKNGINSSRRINVLVYTTFVGSVPEGYVVDHIKNNERDNNQISNLQVLTHRQNCTKDSKTNLCGAYPKRNKWYSRIMINGRSVYLGSYETELDAHHAYINKLKEIEHN